MKDMIIKCKCGCGEEIDKYDNRGRLRLYKFGHQRIGKGRIPELIACSCGCGKLLYDYDIKHCIEREYINGHQNIGKKRGEKFSKEQSQRAKLKGWKPPSRKGIKGELCGKSYKGGISTINNTIRKNSNHKEFSKIILKKDNYTCFICGQVGAKYKNRLVAHHLLLWSEYPKLRFEMYNGICLCEGCHKKVHKRLKKK